MNFSLSKTVVTMIFLVCFSMLWSNGHSQTPGLITVTGEAKLKIKPDQAFINLEIRSFDKDLEKVRVKNEQDIAAIMKIIYEFDIDKSDIGIQFIRFGPDYKDWKKEKIRGYSIVKGMSITLGDITKIENLVCRLIEAGADQFYSIELRCSKEKEDDIRVRQMALDHALKKATSMAGQMGLTLGKIHTILDNIVEPQPATTTIGSRFFHARGGRSFPDSYDPEYGGSFIGKIGVTAKVTVSFELE